MSRPCSSRPTGSSAISTNCPTRLRPCCRVDGSGRGRGRCRGAVAPATGRPYGRARERRRPALPVTDVVMGRLGGLAGVALLGIGLAGCGVSNWIPSWDLKFPSAPPPAATVQVESEPAGAEAKSSVGPSCRTPCALSVATTNPFTVTFTLAGYESLPVPVYAQLEPTPTKGKRPAAKAKAPAPPAAPK